MTVLAMTQDDVADLIRCVKSDIDRLVKEAVHHAEIGERILVNSDSTSDDSTASFHFVRLAEVNQKIGALKSLLSRIEMCVDQ